MGQVAAGGAADADLRPYQAEAVKAIVTGLRDGGLGQAHMACGTGKTLIAARVSAAFTGSGGVIAVLVPSIALAAQTIAAWRAGCPVDQVIVVCSDRTVTDAAGAATLGVPVSTDPEQIAKGLADAAGRVLLVGTYDSAHRLAEGLHRAGQVAELTVCDEAHRLAGAAGKVTAAILEPGVLPERRRLFLTATPKIATGVSSAGELTVASMDDEALFGPVLYGYPFGRAIEEGWLKRYRIVVAALADTQVCRMLDGDGAGLTGENGVPVRMAATQAVLAMTAARLGLRRCLVFLPRVALARQFAATLPATTRLLPARQRPAGPVSAGHVHGQMTSAQRNLVLNRLRHPPADGWAVVANARCLSEGVDVPATDSVLFAEPKKSVIDIVQAVGRALRRHGDADTATIIVPALLPDPGENAGSAAADDPQAAGRWENVLRVVRALCAHDDQLAARLAAIRARRASEPGSPHSPELPDQIQVQAPPGVMQQTLDALRLRIVEGSTSSWWDGYGRAAAYHARHQNLDVPAGYVCVDGFRLGTWIINNRTDRNGGMLPADREAALEALGIRWSIRDDMWQRKYQMLADFAASHGHFRIPSGIRTPDGSDLSEWAERLRQLGRQGKIREDRRQLLNQIGFPWDARDQWWQARYAEARAFKDKHGHLRVPKDTQLARWLRYQAEKLRSGTVGGQQEQLLRDLLHQAGVPTRDGQWQACYQALAEFRAARGHFRVPKGTKTPDGTDLPDWQKTQRRSRSNGTLPPEKAELLDAIGFPWNPRQQAWQDRYGQLRDWKARHGNLDIPADTPLWKWRYQMQRRHNVGQLPGHQAQLLRDLGALTDPRPAAREPRTGTKKPGRAGGDDGRRP